MESNSMFSLFNVTVYLTVKGIALCLMTYITACTALRESEAGQGREGQSGAVSSDEVE
jgi:hypothetical protein